MATITQRTLSVLNDLLDDPQGDAPHIDETLKRIRRAVSENRSAAATFSEHVRNLAEISRAGDELPLAVKEKLLAAFALPRQFESMSASLTSEASFRLAALGIMPIAALLAEGMSMREVSKRLHVPLILLTHFCNLPEHQEAMRLANTARAITAADELFDRALERDDASSMKAMQWIAERLAPNIYAKPSESEAPSESANHLSITLDITPAAVDEGVARRRKTYEQAVKKLPNKQSLEDAIDAVFTPADEV